MNKDTKGGRWEAGIAQWMERQKGGMTQNEQGNGEVQCLWGGWLRIGL